MSGAPTNSLTLKKWEIIFLFIIALSVYSYAAGFMSTDRQPVASSETQFTELSSSGLEIMPASCPSQPHYDGECSPSCTAAYICIGKDRHYRNAQCNASFVQTCEIACVNGECVDVGNLETLPFQATDLNGATFTATGDLQLRASLVRTGQPTRVYWNVVNAASCTVTAPNGDSFTGLFSGAQGQTTRAITQQTTYTLNCIALDGIEPGTIVQTDKVNVIPVFQEP